ncbi:MAG: DUF4179 domain-containing protein [Lachnospiraceae bacterium]|nr:DUF4179 domain-containing protein [Lachnospiraceae bacterium]
MKQEPFKNVYRQIHLSAQQKDRIWKQIGTTANPEPVKKNVFFPTRVAVCLGALLMSGMTVFAANELSLMDRLAEAMNILTQNEKDLTEDQKNLYAQYGQVLNSAIELDNGTLQLDAALYDESNLVIPFRYFFHSDVEGYETLTAGTDFNQDSLRKAQGSYRQDTNTFLRQCRFRIVQNSAEANSQYLITDPILSEDGTISGSLLICADNPNVVEPRGEIQLIRTADAEESPVLYAEFTLEKAFAQHTLAIDAENAAALKDMGISVERMTISPLSLSCSGKGTHTRALSASITVLLKDGRIIKRSPNGSGYALSDANRDNTSFSFFARVLFEEPVLLEDITEIHIQDNRGTDIHIPVEIK